MANCVAELAEKSTIVMLCVRGTEDVMELVLSDGGVAGQLRPGDLVIDCSTISPKFTGEMDRELQRRGIGFVDAPVSGGSEGAAKGTLSVLAGGSQEDFRRAEPILRAIGTTITHLGPAGSGQTAKLLNQILVVVNMLAVSEALAFGRKAGLDLKKTLAAVESGAGGSWMLSQRAPQVLEGYWKPGFTIDLQQKDLDLVLESARQLGVPLLATAAIHQLYSRLQAEGKGHLGNHALIQALPGVWQ